MDIHEGLVAEEGPQEIALMKKLWVFLAVIVVLAIEFVRMTYGEMRSEDKSIVLACVGFRCQFGRWPSSEKELLEKVVPRYRFLVAGPLKRLGVHFFNKGPNLTGQSITVRFVGWRGLNMVDEETFTLDSMSCTVDNVHVMEFKPYGPADKPDSGH